MKKAFLLLLALSLLTLALTACEGRTTATTTTPTEAPAQNTVEPAPTAAGTTRIVPIVVCAGIQRPGNGGTVGMDTKEAATKST